MTRLQKWGIAIIVISMIIGPVGTVWSIYSSFIALETAEFAGIGPVGDQIRNALLFSIGSGAGMVLGVILLIAGRAKRNPESNTGSDR